jgi:hypothetical protein
MNPRFPETERRIAYSRQPMLWLASAFAIGIAAAESTDVHFAIIGGIAIASATAAYSLSERAAAPFLLLAAFLGIGGFCYQFEIAATPEYRINASTMRAESLPALRSKSRAQWPVHLSRRMMEPS